MPNDKGHRVDAIQAMRLLRKPPYRLSLAAIGKLFGVSRQAVHLWLKERK